MASLERPGFVATIVFGFVLWGIGQANVCCGQVFQNRTAEFFPEGIGLGDKAAWGDFNNDGWVDLSAGSRIFQNNGGTAFYFAGCRHGGGGLWGDFNNDGWLDIFGYTTNKSLHYNNGDGSGFVNVTSKLPSSGTQASLGAALADLNNDGYLDIYSAGYEHWAAGLTYPDVIMTYNQASRKFDNTWQETVYRARGVTIADFDRDGDQDVYVSNYRLQPNRLWRNNGSGGGIADVAPAYGVAGTNQQGAYGHTIGSAWGDFDNDGHLDLFVGNFSHSPSYQDRSQFLRNLGPAGAYHFQLKDSLDGADWQESYATPALGDYDNDGDLDLFITTVYGGDYPRLYRNDGNWQFTNVTNSVGLAGLGSTMQAAWADVDNDGDLDLISNSKLFINDSQSNGNHWLKIRLVGDGVIVNRSAIGAQVRIFADGQILTRQVEGGTGEGNQNDLVLHFGLGQYDTPVDVEILWPNGLTQTLTSVSVDELVIVTIPEPSVFMLLLPAVWAVLKRSIHSRHGHCRPE